MHGTGLSSTDGHSPAATGSDAGRLRSARPFLACGAVLCAAATVMFYIGSLVRGADLQPPPAPSANALAAPLPEPTRPDGSGESPIPAALPHSPPARLRIPVISVETALDTVGRTSEGNIGAPDPAAADTPAWYELSVAPGELGTAVIVGHVDSTEGPAVFYRLSTLEPDDTVEVTRADGRVAVFAVDAIHVYPKAEFPARDVLKTRGRAELRLITCGGRFDRRSGYTDNVIVFAHLVEP